jgi:hypothetical protein
MCRVTMAAASRLLVALLNTIDFYRIHAIGFQRLENGRN